MSKQREYRTAQNVERVLFVHHGDQVLRDRVVSALQGLKCDIAEAGDVTGLKAIAGKAPPDLFLIGIAGRSDDVTGLVHECQRLAPEVPCVVVAAAEDQRLAERAVAAGAFSLGMLAEDGAGLRQAVRTGLAYRKLTLEKDTINSALEEVRKRLTGEVAGRKFAEEAHQTILRRLELALMQSNYYNDELRREIDIRQKAEEALAHSEEVRRQQAAREAQEEERKRLAEELHDETLAQLASLAIEFGLMAKLAAKPSPELGPRLQELGQRIKDTQKHLRQIVAGIFPSTLTNLGLVPAVRAYLQDASSRPIDNPSPLSVTFESEGFGTARLAEPAEIALYRVIQQGITNVIQHARATSVRISLKWSGSTVSLLIADDGVGFDVDAPRETPASGHFGLFTLRDRIESLGGEFRTESTPSSGTKITIALPASRKNDASGGDGRQVSRFVFTNEQQAQKQDST